MDEEAVMRARVLLLGSGRLSEDQTLDAYRVLAPVSPDVYAPKLASRLSWTRAATPERAEELAREAVAAARLLRPDHHLRTEVLCRALGSYATLLFGRGRRAEALAVCAESAAVGREGFGRGQVPRPGYGSRRLVVALSEEGRFAEALAAEVPPAGDERTEFWPAVARAARLEAAGQGDEAAGCLGEFLDAARAGAAEGREPQAVLVWALRHQADLLDRTGSSGEAGAIRREALDVLARLAEAGKPTKWGTLPSWWATLFLLSVRPDEPPASPEAPGPCFGEDDHHWSPDVKRAYAAAVPALDAEKAALAGRAEGDPARWLPALSAVHRRLTARAALRAIHRAPRNLDALRPLFDEGVALARRPGAARDAEARALTDLAMFLVAVGAHREAYADLAAAGEVRPRPTIVTRT